MILVDKNINELCLKGILISEGYIPMHTVCDDKDKRKIINS